MTVGRAWLDIDTDILRVLLDLPDSCEIIAAQGGTNGTISLLVLSPDIHPNAMRVKAIYAGAFGGSSFSRWQITAKRNPSLGAGGRSPSYLPADRPGPRESVTSIGKKENSRG